MTALIPYFLTCQNCGWSGTRSIGDVRFGNEFLCPVCHADCSPAYMVTPHGAVAVVLIATGKRKVEVMKLIRAFTGLGLKESKELVDRVPCQVMQGLSADRAETFKSQLEDAGASVDIKY